MGLLERLGIKEKKMKFVEEPGKDYGWNVSTGKQLEARLEVLDQLNALVHTSLEGTSPAQNVEALKEKVEAVDKTVRKSSIAWARARTDEKYRRAVSGYEGLLTGCLRDCDLHVSGMKGQDPVIQGDMARHIERLTNICYFQHALLLVDVTFGDEDVTPTLDKTLVFPPSSQFGYGARPPPEGKEDMAGAHFWEEYAKHMEARLRRLEELDKRRGNIHGRS